MRSVIARRSGSSGSTRYASTCTLRHPYFADSSILSLALFWKEIESFPIRESHTGTYASTELPREAIAPTSPADMNPEGTCTDPEGCWEISDLQNGPGSTVKGLEMRSTGPCR